MSQQELLEKVISVLENNEIKYMATGSIVSSLQGEPRATHGMDIVISIQESAVAKLVKSFSEPDFYLDEQSIIEAVNKKGMFNLIDVKDGGKVDFWILTESLFDTSRFSRRYTEEFVGMKMQVSAPEDTILAKLRWAKLSGGSEKQLTDAIRVYEVQFEKLDMEDIEEWVKKLNIESLWQNLKSEAKAVITTYGV